ncbi:hypothetical protein PM082_022704 [Marasmius tenuissimus]|nr:hypothetical protein PM082_022701 [Marasmius tenuissimus]KAJ8096046.1 hypothetical protein PM082_022704 [Marasmius tenuissimus]
MAAHHPLPHRLLNTKALVLEGTAAFNIAAAMGGDKPPVVQLTSDMKDLTEEIPSQDK